MSAPIATPQLIDDALLARVASDAQTAPRGRKNFNFHPHNDYPAHRLLNGIEPGSYVAPHRHAEASKDETMVVLRGKLGAVFFDDSGNITARHLLTANGSAIGIDIPHNTWHTVLALEPGTIFLEAKAGPYAPLTEEEKASWAPLENEAGAGEYYQRLSDLFS
jgi:cupin fold WbuC family metalloprotein